MKHDKVASQEVYQKVYDQNPKYGCAATGSCPGVRLLPKYEQWLKSPVVDLGCGTGDTVAAIREQGHVAEGIDWIAPASGEKYIRQGDITQPLDLQDFKTAVCIDVIEHIEQPEVLGLLRNMSVLDRQVISINNASSVNVVDGKKIELHVNRRPFDEWRTVLEDFLSVAEELNLHQNQRLYLCTRKDD